MENNVPLALALLITLAVMVACAFLIERWVLRRLVNQAQIILFMAMIGLNFVFEGAGQILWGSDVKALNVGIPETSYDIGGVLLNSFDVTAAVIAALLVALLAIFFQKTAVGRALRAVADDPGAASSIGIPLKNIMLLVWSAAGVVALVAGMMWGARAGVQFALVDLALKALPVLIIGGFSSIPGAIIGGLIIGATEKVLEVYLGPFFGGAIEGWAPYVLAVFFLLKRPEGLFGEKIIRRV